MRPAFRRYCKTDIVRYVGLYHSDFSFTRLFVHEPIIIRPHRNTTYVDAAYCHTRSSVVCLPVVQSVGLSVWIVSPAKAADPIDCDIWFEMWTRVGPRNRVLDGAGMHTGATWRMQLNRLMRPFVKLL